MGRGDSDEAYVLALCDEVLGEQGGRRHRFDWLFGDAGASGRWVRLPVDSFLVVIKPAELACDGRGRLRRVRDCDLHVITVWVFSDFDTQISQTGGTFLCLHETRHIKIMKRRGI
jgi:hypothetical protein